MNVVITGIAGLIGSKFAEWVLGNVPGVKILGIDNLSCGYIENIPNSVIFKQLILGDDDSKLSNIFNDFMPDYVFHFASFAAEGLSPFVRKHNIKNTWLATADIINECISCRSVKRLVFTSSMAVYGQQSPPFDEKLDIKPIDPYGVAKMACEQDIVIAGEQHGLDWCIIRPHNVYGCNQNIWGDYRNVLGIWMRQFLTNEPLRIYGDGNQIRSFSFINDSLPCFWQAAIREKASHQIINLGGTRPTRIVDAANILLDIMGKGKVIHTQPRHEVFEAWSTWQKSVEILGFEDKTPLEDGLQYMWEWAKVAWQNYPERRNPPPIEYEVTKSLYGWWA